MPVKSSALSGNDSLLSIVQMPRGVPVATVAIHNAANAGLLAVRTLGAAESALRRGKREFFFVVIALFWRWWLGAADPTLRRKMAAYMESQEAEVLGKADKLEKGGFRAYLDGA